MRAAAARAPLLLALCAAARGAPTRYAAIASVASHDDGVATAIGDVEKHPSNPLFVQDKPWEPRLDNGYPNVVYDPQEPLGKWRAWYGDCVSGCGTQLVLYANSSDGLAWEKPELGIYDVGAVRKDLKEHGTRNNIVMHGGGVGVYLDPHEKNASRRFKGFGGGGGGVAACFGAGGAAGCVAGTGTSPDGLRWGDPEAIKWPSPDRYDCHSNLFWDEREGDYVATSRDGFSGNPGRTIGIARSLPGEFKWDTSKAPPMVEKGDNANQLYSQITFPWHNAYLGIVMVYEATSSAGLVHCRLSWSPDAATWHWVDAGGLTGRDFIPLGPAGGGSASACTAPWAPLPAVGGHSLNDCDAYRRGERPTHYICNDGDTNGAGELTLEGCRDACAKDAACTVMHWQGEQANNYSATANGQCFLLKSCNNVEEYSSKRAPTFCMQTETCGKKPAPPQPNAFDSHVCFAAASPVTVPGEGVRVYYMGGNGPHSGDRNSSFGLATLGQDRFAGLRGSGTVTTVPLRCGGATLTVTADVLPGGSVRVGVANAAGLAPADAAPVTRNVTDAAVAFGGKKDLAGLVGTDVTLTIELDRAVVYTVGFA